MSQRITVSCPRCSGTGMDTFEDRHTGASRDICRDCGGEGTVPARTRETRAASYALILSVLDAPRVFVRIYRLPAKLSEGYCFGGGVPITFTNVDWFEVPAVESRERLVQFIKGKGYYRPDHRFLVLGEHPDFTFTVDVDPSRPVPAEERRP